MDFGWLWVPKNNISPFLPYGSSKGEGVDKFSVLLFTFGSSKLKQSLISVYSVPLRQDSSHLITHNSHLIALCVLHRSEACDHFVNLAKRHLPLPNLHLREICVQKKKLFAVWRAVFIHPLRRFAPRPPCLRGTVGYAVSG